MTTFPSIVIEVADWMKNYIKSLGIRMRTEKNVCKKVQSKFIHVLFNNCLTKFDMLLILLFHLNINICEI